MAWFTVSLLVCVFENDLLASHHTLRTGGDAVRAVLKVGTFHTLIGSLLGSSVGQTTAKIRQKGKVKPVMVLPLAGSSAGHIPSLCRSPSLSEPYTLGGMAYTLLMQLQTPVSLCKVMKFSF